MNNVGVMPAFGRAILQASQIYRLKTGKEHTPQNIYDHFGLFIRVSKTQTRNENKSCKITVVNQKISRR